MKKTLDIIRAAKAAAPILAAASPEQKNLALEKIADLEKIEIPEEELNASLQPVADANHMPIEEVKRRIPLADYIMDLRVSKALELVKANAVITDEAPAEEKAE